MKHSFTPYRTFYTENILHHIQINTKLNAKWIKDLNVRPDIIKLFKENIGRTLFNINRGNIFLDTSPRVMKIKTKIKNWDLIKWEALLHGKGDHKGNLWTGRKYL